MRAALGLSRSTPSGAGCVSLMAVILPLRTVAGKLYGGVSPGRSYRAGACPDNPVRRSVSGGYPAARDFRIVSPYGTGVFAVRIRHVALGENSRRRYRGR